MAEEELLSSSTVSLPITTTTSSSLLQWSRWRNDGVDVIDQRMVWVVVAIVGTILLKPVRSLINKYRLHQRQKRYPQIVKLEPKIKLSRHHHKKSLATKFRTWATKFKNRYLTLDNLQEVFQQWVLVPVQLLLSACLFVLIMPITGLLRFVGKSLRQILTWGFRSIQFSCKFVYSFMAARLAPPKETVPGVLRKPKAQWPIKKDDNAKQPIIQFNEHSTGQVRTQQYYYNPLAKPGEPVQPHSSRTPPRGNSNNGEATTPAANFIDDPEEIARRLTERQNMNKIKQRIQTPPPKARQKTLVPPTAGKENAAHQNGFANNAEIQATTAKVNPKRPIQRQAAFSETSPPATGGAYAASSPAATFPSTATRKATPLNNATTRANNRMVTPRPPVILSTPRQPLSSQLRKRRMAGETLFSHTPQETSKALEVSGQPKQAKRRRITVRATLPNAQRRVTFLPPGRRITNKREREEQILQEFNRKREKPTSDDANNNTATNATPTPNLPPIHFGAASQGDQAAAPDALPKPFVFGNDKKVPPPGETNPASNAPPKPFVFGGDKKDSTAGVTSTFNFGSANASEGVPNSTNEATQTSTATQPGEDTKPGPFTTNVTGAPTDDTKPPAFATASTGTPSVFLFGANDSGTGTTPAPATFPFGANSTDTGTTPASAENAFQFGANASGTGTTPAPAANAFQFGANDNSTNATAGPATTTPNFQFGATNAGSTPAPADDKQPFQFGATNAGSTPAPADDKQLFQFGATNAGSTPAPANDKQPFQFGATNAGTTPAPAPDAPNGFGTTFSTTPAATATTFAFGSTQPAAKPDPPAGNASDNGPQPSFAFGSTVENTPQPGSATNNTGFGSVPSSFTATSNTQGAGAFQTPPAFGFNSNAGVTPAFQPSFSGTTPSFQPPSSAGVTPGPGGFNFGAAAPSFAATPVPGTGGVQGFSLGSTGGASARRRTNKNRSKRR